MSDFTHIFLIFEYGWRHSFDYIPSSSSDREYSQGLVRHHISVIEEWKLLSSKYMYGVMDPKIIFRTTKNLLMYVLHGKSTYIS